MKVGKHTAEFISIVYYTIIFVLIGIFLTEMNDRFIIYKIIRQDEELTPYKKTLARHLAETAIIILSLTIVSYYSTILLNKVPFFLDKSHGFNHRSLNVIEAGAALRICVFLFSTGLRNKITIVNQYLSN